MRIVNTDHAMKNSGAHTVRCGARGRGTRDAGFSLVEVTLALGLVGFAVIAVLGLLPTGLTTLRQSMDDTVEAQIVQAIAAQSVIANFTNLTNVSYFDDEGQPTKSLASARYTVTVTTNAPVFPGGANTMQITNSLTTLDIMIVSRGETNRHTLKVANSGK
jgi:uncharacterized protein (TIGR02598 family)